MFNEYAGVLAPAAMLILGGIMSRRALRFALLAAIGLLISASTAEAAQKRTHCSRSGDRLVERTYGVVFYAQPAAARGNWERGAVRLYACSLKLHKRVFLGTSGVQSGREQRLLNFTGNDEFAAYSTSTRELAGGAPELSVFRHSLRSGRVDNYPLTGDPSLTLRSIQRLEISSGGMLAWTVLMQDGGKAAFLNRRGMTETLSSDPNIDASFLRFDWSKRAVVWSTSSIGMDFDTRELDADDPPEKPKRCLRRGFTLRSAQQSVFIVSKKRKVAGWKSGPFRIYGCSSRFGRLVYLGTEGLDQEGGRGFLQPTVAGDFIAYFSYAFIYEQNESFRGPWAVDLRTGKRATAERNSSYETVDSLNSIALTSDGSVAWITEARDTPEVHLFDRNGSRVVASGDTIDEEFLRFEESSGKLIWSNAVSSVPLEPASPRLHAEGETT
ncbi:MAG: hypothetical protein JHD02_08905 [Thermoleophilaceae bacterium]|nr:hypothetical protein [Thermoleophilaceae bacterium]